MERRRTFIPVSLLPRLRVLCAAAIKIVAGSICAAAHTILKVFEYVFKLQLTSFAYPNYHAKLVNCPPGRGSVAPRHLRCGATVFGVSLALLVCVGILSIFLQSLTREIRQQAALNTVDIIAAHAANLDFWVNAQTTTLDPLVTVGGVIVLDTTQTASLRSAQTTTPFYSTLPRDWQFQYLVTRPTTETALFGILIAQPQTTYARALSEIAQPFLSERIGAAQLGGGTSDTLDARGIAAAALPGGLAATDVALYSFKLNGLNPDLVRRRVFSGFNTPTLGTDFDLGSNNVANTLSVEADQGQAASLTAQAAADIFVTQLNAPTTSVSSLTLNGDAATTTLASQSVSTAALRIQGNTVTQTLNTSGKVNIPTVSALITATPSNLYVSGTLGAQSVTGDVLITNVLAASGTAEFQQTEMDRLTLQTLTTSRLTVTGGCSGC